MNTALALAKIQDALKNRSKRSVARPIPAPQTPRRLAELISEKLVKAIWEDNHSSRFEDAIMRAAPKSFEDLHKSWKVFQQIIRATEAAYRVNYWGMEFLAKPKANILHKGLDEIAKIAGLKDLTEKGFAEFLDDLCPCGLKNHREAIRKLSRRSAQVRRPKV